MSKDTFEEIISLKSWGIYTEEEEKRIKEALVARISEENNYIFIPRLSEG
jgi:hypothetical protein